MDAFVISSIFFFLNIFLKNLVMSGLVSYWIFSMWPMDFLVVSVVVDYGLQSALASGVAHCLWCADLAAPCYVVLAPQPGMQPISLPCKADSLPLVHQGSPH